jgi:DNA modification methylase
VLTGSATILRADARSLPLANAAVDLVVTSPPYFALRSYTDNGEHYDGQIGAETTPAEYIAALMDCTREWMRVLKPSGSIWVNLGDKYSDRGHGPSRGRGTGRGPQSTLLTQTRGPMEKSLLLLPERYRIACVDELGLIARAVVVWSKPNGMPESVTDRVRRSHEDWVHLTKCPAYFSAVDEVREQHARQPRPNERLQLPGGGMAGQRNIPGRSDYGQPGSKPSDWNPLGRLPGSVWEIPTEPLTVPDHLGVDHFAAFPTEWPRRIILGWSPTGICDDCGVGRRPVVTAQRMMDGHPRDDLPAWAAPTAPRRTPLGAGHRRFSTDRVRTGEACACPDSTASTRPALVLDPFGGTGTTALVAKALGRHGISVDRSADYCRLAEWRTTDPGQLAKAMRVEKPPVQLDGQADLLAELGEAS